MKMKKRNQIISSRIRSIFTAFVFVGLLTVNQTVFAEDFKWPPLVRIATPTTQSATFASTNGWAPILKADVGANVRVVPEDSELRRYVRFAVKKQFDLNSVAAAEVASAIQGKAGYKTQRAAPIRIAWFQNDSTWGFAVRGDSELKTIYDLKKKGVKVTLLSAGLRNRQAKTGHSYRRAVIPTAVRPFPMEELMSRIFRLLAELHTRWKHIPRVCAGWPCP